MNATAAHWNGVGAVLKERDYFGALPVVEVAQVTRISYLAASDFHVEVRSLGHG